jgi:hypothetical protein
VWLAHVCRTDWRLLGLCIGVLLLHLYLLVSKPEWIALTPLGPTQNSRFWGLGNQLSTLMLAPMIAAAAIAARRIGVLGFLAVAGFSIVLMTDNRLGSNGGGAVVLVVAFAFLGTRMLRIGVRGFLALLLAASGFTVWLIKRNLDAPGPNHLRSAFGHGIGGYWAVLRNRVPLSYMPAIHNWTVVLPLALWFVVSFAVAVYVAKRRSARDFVFTLGVATVVSLLINDSAMYVLTGGVAALGALVRFAPAPAVPFSLRSFVRVRRLQPAPVEALDD